MLTAVALAVALALPLALELGTNEQELAGAALGACVVQGFVFWLMRRRYRRVRQEVIDELRGMLHDRINNHLTVVLMSVTERRDHALNQADRELLEAAIRATRAVSATLAELSTESLHRWKVHYAAALLDQASFGGTPVTSDHPGPPAVRSVGTFPRRSPLVRGGSSMSRSRDK